MSLSQGTAVFWYNLLRSGEGDYRTRHAACPVLVGCKWGEWLEGECGRGLGRRCRGGNSCRLLSGLHVTKGYLGCLYHPARAPAAGCQRSRDAQRAKEAWAASAPGSLPEKWALARVLVENRAGSRRKGGCLCEALWLQPASWVTGLGGTSCPCHLKKGRPEVRLV